MRQCPDCGTKNKSFQEYCVRCGRKLTRSHRHYHLTVDAKPRFILDRTTR